VNVSEAFRRTITTRGYELDTTRSVAIPVVMNYLEHLRWEVMQEPELGLTASLERGHFFVVGQQDVELVRRVGMGVPLEVSLAMRKVGRSRVVVDHTIRRVDRDKDTMVAHAQVTGMWMGPNRRLARVPDALREIGRRHEEVARVEVEPLQASGFPTREEAPSFIDRPEVTHRTRGLDHLRLPELTAEIPSSRHVYRHRLVVRPSDLDIFEHVNASTYLQFFEDARHLAGSSGELTWSDGKDRDVDPCKLALTPHARASVSYHREALLGDSLEVVCWLEEDEAEHIADRFQFLLLRGDEAPLCRGSVEVD